ncbi:MAG: hypothetical protein FVQ80_11065 [Planctomycetes bacterium]|nr:hypothetical protein [Planctomycetota bacterium]
MGDVVRYGTSENTFTTRGPSPEIWKDCPIQSFQEDPGKGIHVFDDFRNSIVLKETASGTDFTSSVGRVAGDINWYSFVETTKLVDHSIPQNDIGVLQLLGDTSDQDVNVAVTGFNVQGIIKTPKVGEEKRFWFEARVKVSTITDADLGMFIGLTEPGQAANAKGVFAGDAAALDSNADYIGFAILEGDGDDIIVAYNEASAGTAQSSTGVITPVADTYVRLGIKLVVLGSGGAKIRFFADGVDLGDAVAVDISGTNANWPGDTDMDLVLSLVTGSGGGSDDALSIDWVRFAQEY